MFSLFCGCFLLSKLKMFAQAQEEHARQSEENVAIESTAHERAAD
jgi:hypothetical protein